MATGSKLLLDPALPTLVEHAKNGDQGAMNALIAECRPAIYKRALCLLNTTPYSMQKHEDAEDIAQITALKISMGLKTLKNNFSFMDWAKRIVWNETIDLIKRRKRETVKEGALQKELRRLEEFNTVEEEPRMIQKAEDVAKDLKGIFESIYTLRYRQELGYKEIADSLKLSRTTVKRRLQELRAMVEEKLRKDG